MGKIKTNLTIFHFGKHKGLSLEEIARIDPHYIVWAAENIAESHRPHIPNDVYLKAVEECDGKDDYGVEELYFGEDYSGVDYGRNL